MEIGDWPTTSDLNDIFRDAQKHGLVENIAELEAFGFTVVPPAKVAPADLHDRLRQAVIDIHARRTGHRIVDITSETQPVEGQHYVNHFNVLFEDPVFEEALLNPTVYTMARYLCGNSVVLSDVTALVKGCHDEPVQPLHMDQAGTPPPLPAHAQLCNVTWALTDYTVENGPVCIVPGSHRFGRPPTHYERDFLADGAPVQPIPVEAPAGSLIIWSGNTWHTTFPRKAPGLRLNVIFVFCRSYIRPIQDYRRENPCPQAVIDRNPPEFESLLGMSHPYPFPGGAQPPREELDALIRSGRSAWS